MASTWNPEEDPAVPPLTEAEIWRYAEHCHDPFMMTFPSVLRQVEKAGSLDYVEDESLRPKDSFGNPVYAFEYAEHAYLGDMLSLKWHDGQAVLASKKPFTLENGLQVTYGQINALGGDYYGSDRPICQGENLEEQISRFFEGWRTLAVDRDRTPDEARSFIKMKEDEVNLINKAVRENKNPSQVYREEISSTRNDLETAFKGFLRPKKGYVGLALINFDHFGEDARIAYNAGHLAAIRHAASGKSPQHLETAYAMNAFADHFLEDSFASGHIRTPRQKLHGTVRVDMDVCSLFMHDEDNALGLTVRNPVGEEWRAYGDRKLLDDVNKSNLERCHTALMASTIEIYEAWSSGHASNPDTFKAWSHAPVIGSAFSDKNHAPLFNADGYPRKNIDDPWDRSYKGYWGFTYPATLVSLKMSSKFQRSIEA